MSLKSLAIDSLGRLLLRRSGGAAPIIFPNLDGVVGTPRNLLINGDFHFWQRGTSGGTVTTTASYMADRFLARACGGSASFLHQRSALVPNNQFRYSARMLENGDLSGNAMVLSQRIEAATIRSLIGSTVNFSLWVRNDSVQLTWTLQARLPISEDNWNADPLSDTIFASSAAIAGPSPSGSSWKRLDFSFVVPEEADNGMSVMLLSNSYSGTPDVYTTGWMLTEGKNPQPNFQRHGITLQQELAACQRFYEKSYSPDVAPGTNTSTGLAQLVTIANGASTSSIVSIPFKTVKRNSPTIAFYLSTGTAGVWATLSPSDGSVTMAASGIGDNSFFAGISGGATLVADDPLIMGGHWTAEIEL